MLCIAIVDDDGVLLRVSQIVVDDGTLLCVCAWHAEMARQNASAAKETKERRMDLPPPKLI